MMHLNLSINCYYFHIILQIKIVTVIILYSNDLYLMTNTVIILHINTEMLLCFFKIF